MFEIGLINFAFDWSPEPTYFDPINPFEMRP